MVPKLRALPCTHGAQVDSRTAVTAGHFPKLRAHFGLEADLPTKNAQPVKGCAF